MIRIILFVISCIIYTGCSHPLPTKKLSQWKADVDYHVKNDSLYIAIRNSLKCPVRFIAKSSNNETQELLNQNFPILLDSHKDTVFLYKTTKTKEELALRFSATMGDPKSKVNLNKIALPFPKNKKYKIIQGYNGKYSHSSAYSKYAIDFNLAVGDTICAVADGYIVGVIKDYKYGGGSKKWRDYANFITVFHPEMNIYTQYVHLDHQGSLVQVGDAIKKGQPIGISGETGYTDMPHLHFNVLVASEKGMKSIPVEFIEGYKGIDFKKGDFVLKK